MVNILRPEAPTIDAPSTLYVTREDQLFLRVQNAAAGVVLSLRARYLTPEGRMVEARHDVTPSTDRAVSTSAFQIGEGYLFSVTVEASTGTPRRGQCFAQVGLVRGGERVSEPVAVLAAGYVTASAFVSWPPGDVRASTEGPGLIRSVTGTDPAANVEISETVPTDARWLLHGFRATLVTDATVANRRVHLIVDDGATILLDVVAPDVQAASLTRNYNGSAFGYAVAAQDSELYLALPVPIPLPPGGRVRTNTTNRAAGDNWGAPQLLVEEWIED